MEHDLSLLEAKTRLIKSGKRRMVHWPLDIQNECLRLINAGTDVNSIAKTTGITTKTLTKWLTQPKRQHGFSEVNLVAWKSIQSEAKTFTLMFPSGSWIGELSFDNLKVLKGCGLI